MRGCRSVGAACVLLAMVAVDRAEAQLRGPLPPPKRMLAPLHDAGAAAADEAQSILARSRAAYAACDTYEDDGVFVETFRARWRPPETGTFRTAFAGPHAFRFMLHKVPDSVPFWTQIVADDSGVRYWLRPGEKEHRAKSLDLGIASLLGTSDFLAVFIPALLRVDAHARTLLDVSDPRVTTYGDLDGTTCDLIDATWASRRIQLWIARTDSLLRRVVLEIDFLTMADYHPRCNQPVAPEALRATDGGL